MPPSAVAPAAGHPRPASVHAAVAGRLRRAGGTAVLLLGTSLAVASCRSYQPMRADAPTTAEAVAAGTMLRAKWSTPRRVTLWSATGDSVTSVVARELSGPLVRLASDTVILKAWSGRDELDGAIAPPPGTEARLLEEPGLVLGVQRADARATRRAAGLMLLAAALVAAVVWLWTNAYSGEGT